METIQSLITKNGSYHSQHEVRDYDVTKCNLLIAGIEVTRSNKEPKAGDIIQCCGPKKEYLFGHLDYDLNDKKRNGYAQVCVQPYVSFTWYNAETGLSFSTSGGYWFSKTEKEMYEYIGKGKKLFCTWGHCGACGNGAVHFETEVNIWKIFREDIY